MGALLLLVLADSLKNGADCPVAEAAAPQQCREATPVSAFVFCLAAALCPGKLERRPCIVDALQRCSDGLGVHPLGAQLVAKGTRAAGPEGKPLLHPITREGMVIDKADAREALQGFGNCCGGKASLTQALLELSAGARPVLKEPQGALLGAVGLVILQESFDLLLRKLLPLGKLRGREREEPGAELPVNEKINFLLASPCTGDESSDDPPHGLLLACCCS